MACDYNDKYTIIHHSHGTRGGKRNTLNTYAITLNWVITEGNEERHADSGMEVSFIRSTSKIDAARKMAKRLRNQQYVKDVTCVDSGSVTYAGGSRVAVVNTLYCTRAEDNLMQHTFMADIELEAEWESRIEAEAQAG